MSAFCGAWSLDGRPVEGPLPERPARAAEFECGRLWLAAERGAVAREGSRLLAVEGFLAGGLQGPVEPTLRDGHYSYAYAEADQGRLTLGRDAGGGERLYWLKSGGRLIFSTSIRPLLALAGVRRELDAEVAAEQVMNKAIVFGDRTLWAGIREVPPGRRLVVDSAGERYLESWDPAPRAGASGDAAGYPARLKRALQEGVSLAVGRDGRAAVALSGGIDSAAIAACAVETLGPERVRAFTIEFEDATHPSEVERAAAHCRRLGIGHRVLKIAFEDYWNAIPEAVWRIEHPFDVKHGAQMLLLCREAGREGFGKLLTGNGIEQCLGVYCHDAYVDRLARSLARLPDRAWALGHWARKAFGDRTGGLLPWALGALPGVPPAPPREIYHHVVSVLRHNGVLGDVGALYPEDLREWGSALAESERVRADVRADSRPLALQLRARQFHFFATRCSIRPIQKPGREAGAVPVSPAFFASCLALAPEAYRLTGGDSAVGRALQRQAFRKEFGDAADFSPKPGAMELSQTVVSPAWYRETVARLSRAVAGQLEDCAAWLPPFASAARTRYPENLAQLALWRRLFVESRPSEEPPAW